MKKILFVDDDTNVIEGLKRMLRPLRQEWTMQFAISGPQALQMMEQEPVDVLVTDMRMPQMDGAELLTIVMSKFPKTIRIILSGYSEQELILKSVRPAHQFLSKPCSAEKLLRAIERASKLQSMLESEEIKKIISRMDSLPSQPALYTKIIEKLNDPNASIRDIGLIIEQDVGMSVQILKLINSSFFGFYKEITSPVQAANLLGINTIKTLVLSIEIFSLFKVNAELSTVINRVWKMSTITGHFCRLIARELSDSRINTDDAFMVGFIHDIGFLVLAAQIPELTVKIIKQAIEQKTPIFDMEKKYIGTTHAQIGAYLLGLWGFPDKIIESLLFYRDPGSLGTDEIHLGHILHITVAFCHHLFALPEDIYQAKINLTLVKKLGLESKIKEWFSYCKQMYASGEQNE